MDTTGLRRVAGVALAVALVLAGGASAAAAPVPTGALSPEPAPSWLQDLGAWIAGLATEVPGELFGTAGPRVSEVRALERPGDAGSPTGVKAAGDDPSADPQLGMDADPDG